MASAAQVDPADQEEEVFEPDRKVADFMEEHARKFPGKPWVSFEYFPPKTPLAVENLHERLGRMVQYHPMFVDFTWGAGGSTAELTLDLTLTARDRWGLLPNMHLTCTNMPQEKVTETLKTAREHGITNIFALRGDPPAGQTAWEVVDGGLSCARDLVEYIRKEHGDFFCVGVAGYPEGHPNRISRVDSLDELTPDERVRAGPIREESGNIVGYNVCRDKDFEEEMVYLKSKIDAGADFIVTQMFFDTEVYFAFVKACRRSGITVPIIPGIICVSTVGGFIRMINFCKTKVSQALYTEFTSLKPNDDEGARKIGIRIGTEMCRQLMKGGVPGLHFYTLNLEKCIVGILLNLKVEVNGDGMVHWAPAAHSVDGSGPSPKRSPRAGGSPMRGSPVPVKK